MRIHFIAIGGSAMHNLAIALKIKGYQISGSDDEIFEPSKSRLQKYGILPAKIGWEASDITDDLDAVILGMHARENNPELIKAKELGIQIFSYPEYLFEKTKTKKRVVIGGSHGKTTITSMLLHAVKKLNKQVDYMVGAQLPEYECMVSLSEQSDIAILEGDEYLSSPIDRRPKFHLYSPNIALISGIAWDHINVFPTFKEYVNQFEIFLEKIEKDGILVYNEEDIEVKKLVNKTKKKLKLIPYRTPEFKPIEDGTVLYWNKKEFNLKIFGSHNLQNLIGSMHLAESIGISNEAFLKSMSDFKGAGKRLQKVVSCKGFEMYKDFAHSPSKLKATTNAIKQQFRSKKLIACMELHTFSSLKKGFLSQYENAMHAADIALVYFSPKVVEHKKLEPITKQDVIDGFGGNITVVNSTEEVLEFIYKEISTESVLLMMSSGNFDGVDYDVLGQELSKKL